MPGFLRSAAKRILPRNAVTRVLGMLSVSLPVRIQGHSFRVPLLGGVGLSNTGLAATWKTVVIERVGNVTEGVFLDVGVNLGQTLIDLRATHPEKEYIGFEPNPVCVHYVNTLIRINGLTNCSVIPAGLGGGSRVMQLFLQESDASDPSATLIGDLRPQRQLRSSFVSVFRFDEIRDQLLPGPVGFVKIDVEGAEREVLQGMQEMIARDRPILLCEVLFADPAVPLAVADQEQEALMSLLRDMGYSVLRLNKSRDGSRVDGVERTDRFPSAHWSPANADQCDYLFIPRESEDGVLRRLSE